MSRPLTAKAALNRYFLEMRCKIIEIAATLDRIAEGEGSAANDARIARIHEALDILRSDRADKAAACQLAFSLNYAEGWNAPNAR